MITAKTIEQASLNLEGIIEKTPLHKNLNISIEYDANVFLKREDLQIVRSYKIRGAYNKIFSLTEQEKKKGIVCASAGNHAQGVAHSCNLLQINGTIFMPNTTPKQKINKTKKFGNSKVEVILIGDTYDQCYEYAIEFCEKHDCIYIHAFDDDKIIEGQGTIGKEIFDDAKFKIDYVFVPIGGGGLASGLSIYLKEKSPDTKIIGVEPAGAPSMKEAFLHGGVVELSNIDVFIDGASVKKVGVSNYNICKKYLDDVIAIPEGKVCSTILDLYNEDAIIVEPAGALAVSALEVYKNEIKGKNVVCILSGSNNDISRTEEIKERSLLYEGLKHYFLIKFPQRAGALKEFVNNVLGQDDDITFFEYSKKNNRAKGPAVVGIEQKEKGNFGVLLQRLKEMDIQYQYLNNNDELFHFIV